MCACFQGEKELFTLRLPFGLQQGQQLLAELNKKLQEEGIPLQTIGAVAVGVGPGSYTGIRIAATIGKMLSFGLKIPLVGVSTLETFAPEAEGKFGAVLDAKIGGIYLQLGEKKGENVLFSTPPQMVSVETALPLLEGRILVSPDCKPLKIKLHHTGPWEEAPPLLPSHGPPSRNAPSRGKRCHKWHFEPALPQILNYSLFI